jgi:hypothetical protein
MSENIVYRYRVTILRASGSVWVQDFESPSAIANGIEDLIAEYPHLVVSKQRIVVGDE